MGRGVYAPDRGDSPLEIKLGYAKKIVSFSSELKSGVLSVYNSQLIGVAVIVKK